MSTNYGGGGSTRNFSQQDRDLIISSGNATAAGIGTGVPTGTRTTTVTPVTTREPVEPTITRSTPTTSGNTSNQILYFLTKVVNPIVEVVLV